MGKLSIVHAGDVIRDHGFAHTSRQHIGVQAATGL